jgi:hypothetical protein
MRRGDDLQRAAFGVALRGQRRTAASPSPATPSTVTSRSLVFIAKARPAGDEAADIVSGRGRCSGCGFPMTPVSL